MPFNVYVVMFVALSFFSVACADDATQLLQQATEASVQGRSDTAVAKLTQLIALEPKNSQAYYLRGREQFRLGKVKESVADFDKAVELDPESASRQWERGIAYYYNGDFERGAKQFEQYQTYHDQDVENSAWRYLCVARSESVAKARDNMLPIERDARVPMMQIYDLYRGKLKPDAVLAAANAGDPGREALNIRLFYAQLYLGLWHEAAGEQELAKAHILEAEKHRIGHYMWDVAHVHAERLRAAAQTP